ncbi:uncharacterized protein LOC132790366 [Drosophila nasuta]|uniref:uncharacterized protein LOC132790366 n=1 Tax=Drosophila nasuta TaxID=42062 RepID=UPI00295E69DC|nr:uncharacterized protein LOC132790366 [Drosophila nasuta]
MEEPSEEFLDRHFNQQLIDFHCIFNKTASESDQTIASCWIQIFKMAPRDQKLSRNCLTLLMYGHLNDFGHLQYPFTDLRNCAKDLNDVLNGYNGFPKQKLVNMRQEETVESLSTDKFSLASTVSMNSSSSSHLALATTATYTRLPKKSSKEESNIFRFVSMAETTTDTYDSHECYKSMKNDENHPRQNKQDEVNISSILTNRCVFSNPCANSQRIRNPNIYENYELPGISNVPNNLQKKPSIENGEVRKRSKRLRGLCIDAFLAIRRLRLSRRYFRGQFYLILLLYGTSSWYSYRRILLINFVPLQLINMMIMHDILDAKRRLILLLLRFSCNVRLGKLNTDVKFYQAPKVKLQQMLAILERKYRDMTNALLRKCSNLLCRIK